MNQPRSMEPLPLRAAVVGAVLACGVAAANTGGPAGVPCSPVEPPASDDQASTPQSEGQWRYDILCRQFARLTFDAPTPGERNRLRARALAHLYEIEAARAAYGVKPGEGHPFPNGSKEEVQALVKSLETQIRDDGPDAPVVVGKGQPQRTAFLNFGLPTAPSKLPRDDGVGWEIRASAWRAAIPLLEADRVDIVVIRVNSKGESFRESLQFHRLFHDEFKRRFRTMAWVEIAQGAAAMSVWPLEEIVLTRNGSIGKAYSTFEQRRMRFGLGCPNLEEVILSMESASRMGRHDFRVMRAMQILEPLSANISADGDVDFFQDLSGQSIISDGKGVLTLTAENAMKYRVAKGVADTREELMKVMGVPAWEAAGAEAVAFLDETMTKGIEVETRFEQARARYDEARKKAGPNNPAEDRAARLALVARAKEELAAFRAVVEGDPYYTVRIQDFLEWLREEERALQELKNRP